jgi:hypothetical protein
MSRMIRLVVVLLVGVLSFLSVGNKASAGCLNNQNSSLQIIEGQEVCAGTGDGCSSCYTSGGRGNGSWDLCYIDWATGDEACTYYN